MRRHHVLSLNRLDRDIGHFLSGAQCLLGSFVGLLTVACCAVSVPAKTLEWNLDADQRYRISVERTVQQKSLATEWPRRFGIRSCGVVTGRDADGQMQIVQSLTEVKHVLQFPDARPVVYDSASDVEPQGDAAELARYWKSQLVLSDH